MEKRGVGGGSFAIVSGHCGARTLDWLIDSTIFLYGVFYELWM